MAISSNATAITFNDATTQTTAPVNTNANVNSVSAGTGISVNSTTGAVTVTNSGVTSLTAGTGISLSAGTGGVTITNSQPGAVSSVNGQTGAVSTVTALAVGSTIACYYNSGASGGTSNNQITPGTTISGSSASYGQQNPNGTYLGVDAGPIGRSVNGGPQALSFASACSANYVSVGSTLPGSWVAFTTASQRNEYNPATPESAAYQGVSYPMVLWARYA